MFFIFTKRTQLSLKAIHRMTWIRNVSYNISVKLHYKYQGFDCAISFRITYKIYLITCRVRLLAYLFVFLHLRSWSLWWILDFFKMYVHCMMLCLMLLSLYCFHFFVIFLSIWDMLSFFFFYLIFFYYHIDNMLFRL